MKHLSLLFFISVLTSCHFFGPVDEQVMKDLSEKPSVTDLSGTWEADSFSYELIKRYYGVSDQKVKLIIDENNSFKAVNFPDFVTDITGMPVQEKLMDAEGRWGVKQTRNSWRLALSFSKGALFESGMQMSCNLYKKNSKLVIVMFVGDPDQGDRLLFVKK